MNVSHIKTWEQLIPALYNQEVTESMSLELAPQDKGPGTWSLEGPMLHTRAQHLLLEATATLFIFLINLKLAK